MKRSCFIRVGEILIAALVGLGTVGSATGFQLHPVVGQPVIVLPQDGGYLFAASAASGFQFVPGAYPENSAVDFDDVLRLESVATAQFYRPHQRRWSDALVDENSFAPSWLTAQEVGELLTPPGANWLMYYGPAYPVFEVSGSLVSGDKEVRYRLVLDLDLQFDDADRTTINVNARPKWIFIHKNPELYIDAAFYRARPEDIPLFRVRLSFSVPGLAEIAADGSAGLMPVQTEGLIADIARSFTGIEEWLQTSIKDLEQRFPHGGWVTPRELGLLSSGEPMRNDPQSPFNKLTVNALVLKASLRKGTGPFPWDEYYRILEESQARIGALLRPGQPPPPTMRLHVSE
jgi:hypothetical protein